MRIRRTLNPSLEIEGILLTMYDERTTLSRQVATDLRSFFGTQIFQSVIPRNVRLAEAPSFGNQSFFTTFTAKGRKATPNSPRRLLPMPRNALGRGLGALIREPEPKAHPESASIQHQATTASGAAVAPTREAVPAGREKWTSISSSRVHTSREHVFERKRWTSWRARFRLAGLFSHSLCGPSARDFS